MNLVVLIILAIVIFTITILKSIRTGLVGSYRKLKAIETTPTTPICKTNAFSSGHIIEVKGTISGDIITSPYSKKDCFFYDSKEYEEYIDRSGEENVTRRIDTNRLSSANFLYISDETGKIRIDLTGFRANEFCKLFKVATDSDREKHMLTPKNRDIGAKVFREEYYLLPTSSQAYVLGVYCSDVDGGYICANPDDSDLSVFILSSEDALKRKLRKTVNDWIWAILFLGLILAAVVFLFFLWRDFY